MGYYTRIFGTRDEPADLERMLPTVKGYGTAFKIDVAEGETFQNWSELTITGQDDRPWVCVTRDIVTEGSLGSEELEEFRQEIADCKPVSAVRWLGRFFQSVKVIYAFQMLDAVFEDPNFEMMSQFRSLMADHCRGIFQADREGFSNQQGDHILWQFDESVAGPWRMGVLDFFGNWKSFTMDLGDPGDRAAFLAGKKPKHRG